MYAKLIKLSWIIFISGMLALVLWVVAVSNDFGGWFGGMPDLTRLENPKSELASELWSADGVLLGKYFRENRTPAKYEDFSPNLLNALYATEDIRFDNHSGVDFRGTFSIIYHLLVRGKKKGGSTITQQLAKNLFSTRTELEGKLSRVSGLSTLIAKTKEWILAIQLERSYTKKEIVTMYLNDVEMSSNAFGVKVAAKTYFNTSPDSLSVQEAAVLVGMLKSPTRYNPILNPTYSLNRRNTVIEQMEKYKFLTTAEADSIKQLPLVTDRFSVENQNTGLATYFRTVMRNHLLQWQKNNGVDLFSDGLKIYTTIDSRMQKYAEEAVAEHMAELQGKFFAHWKGRNPWVDQNLKEIPGFLERAVKNTDHYRYLKRSHGDDTVAIWKVLNTPVKMKVFAWNNPKQEIDTVLSPIDSVRYYKHHLHTGLMSVDPHTGHIKAWVGGINHKYFKFDNVRQSRRQPGSTFKPIVYAAAMAEQAYSPCFEVIDAPQTFVLEAGGTWTARNFGEYTHNTYTLRQALAQSINTVAAFLMRRLKPGTVVDYARKFGITSPLDAVPALALGAGGDVSVYEMVGAYASFVNKGTWIEPTFITHITDKNGKVLYQHIPQKKEVLKEETAYLMTYMLRGATEEKGGTGLGLWRYEFRKNNQVACKTGTTQNYSDGWFMGMTKDLVTGVWVGGEERSIHFRTGDFGQGSRMAMPAYAFYTEKVFADPTLGYTKGEFPVPEEPLSVELNCARYKQIALTDSVIYRMPTGNPLDND